MLQVLSVRGHKPRCAGGCGAFLSVYNHEPLCGACSRTAAEAELAHSIETSRYSTYGLDIQSCRHVECDREVCERSLATNAPRWRELCDEHYDEQRARQSFLTKQAMAARACAPPAAALA